MNRLIAITDHRANIIDQPQPDPALDAIADQLALIRLTSQQRRYPGRAVPKLPSKPAILQILGDVIGLLYPRHFGPEGLAGDAIDTHVRRTLARTRLRLAEQIELEWLLAPDADPDGMAVRALAASDAFLHALPQIRDLHDTDIAAAYRGDPSARSLDEVVFCFPGVAAMLRHRIAHRLGGLGARMIARIMAEYSHALSGIDIHPGAQIGPACFIDHGTGVVIGETAVVGRNVRLYQQVTLGAKRFEDDGEGGLVKGQPRHPVIGDDVVIYAGATILGRIEIGKGAIIGGGVWVTDPVAPGTVVSQARPRLDHP
ncbi:serine acetyltransferase [uncultured Paracoccus sp.]|uniref:serine O-acetyltransferase n=1 Tax=uncultured Paracoccus sp. TaxID=189685 RepID=UPI00260040B7|nr:serine acetyltransferase [uncultured Paracoccus sp.]